MSESKPLPKKERAARRSKYDWNLVGIQFLTSDHQDFLSFLKDFGYPESLRHTKFAKDIATKKRTVMAAQTERIREAMLAEPLRAREERRFRVLKDLADSARGLRGAIVNRVATDLHLTNRREGQSMDDWTSEMRRLKMSESILTPGELMALSVAQKHVDELIRKAEGLEDFDWEAEERNQKAIAKAAKLEFEIVQTSNAKPLAELPYAPEAEERKQA